GRVGGPTPASIVRARLRLARNGPAQTTTSSPARRWVIAASRSSSAPRITNPDGPDSSDAEKIRGGSLGRAPRFSLTFRRAAMLFHYSCRSHAISRRPQVEQDQPLAESGVGSGRIDARPERLLEGGPHATMLAGGRGRALGGDAGGC